MNLKVISRNGVAIDNVDLEAAKKLNITVRKTGGAMPGVLLSWPFL